MPTSMNVNGDIMLLEDPRMHENVAHRTHRRKTEANALTAFYELAYPKRSYWFKMSQFASLVALSTVTKAWLASAVLE